MKAKQHNYAAWVHPGRRLSFVFNRKLNGWNLKHHRKDGGTRVNGPTLYGSGRERDGALRAIRKYWDGTVPMSGWVRATGVSRATTWDGVHNDLYHQVTR